MLLLKNAAFAKIGQQSFMYELLHANEQRWLHVFRPAVAAAEMRDILS